MIRRRRLDTAVNRERWLISYADFITLLLALFVVLFASSRLDRKKARQVAHAVTEALHGGDAAEIEPQPAPAAHAKPGGNGLPALLEFLNSALADEIRAGKIALNLDSRGLTISLRQAAFFPSGGDEIAPSEYHSLERIANAVRDLPNAIQFEGHTDSTPIHNQRFRSNWELSAARSIAMLRLFEDRFGLPPDRFAVAGYGETKPVDSNGSAEGRGHNRRVDIVILNR